MVEEHGENQLGAALDLQRVHEIDEFFQYRFDTVSLFLVRGLVQSWLLRFFLAEEFFRSSPQAIQKFGAKRVHFGSAFVDVEACIVGILEGAVELRFQFLEQHLASVDIFRNLRVIRAASREQGIS